MSLNTFIKFDKIRHNNVLNKITNKALRTNNQLYLKKNQMGRNYPTPKPQKTLPILPRPPNIEYFSFK